MNKPARIKFSHFIEKFPVVDLPVTLTNESAHHFSQQNDPFPALMIRQYLLPFERNVAPNADEFLEYVPCLQIPNTVGFKAVVYWKAELLTYDYVLMTFTDKGDFIDKKEIAGTKVDGDALAMVVATIDEDWVIHVVGGVNSVANQEYDPSNSQSFQLELLPTGEIIKSEDIEE